MHKTSFILFVLLSISSTLFSQATTESDRVHSALMDYIEGFYDGDSAKIIRSISPQVVKYGYWKEANALSYVGEPMSYQEMIDYAVKVSKKTKKAKVGALEKAEVFEIQDQTASAKVTAWWGTDYILLEKVQDAWMIRMVLWQGPLKKTD